MAGDDRQWSSAGGSGIQRAAAWERGGQKWRTAVTTAIKNQREWGMVQANVGQKLVKRNILRVFFVTHFVFVTLLLANMMLN